jgi:aerobic carbon-monoxide dehydrogenase small subunit
MVNGRACPLDVEPRTTLAEVLGDTSVHLGCTDGRCGACTVLVDGEAVRSCLMFAVQAGDAHVRTLEGLAVDHPLRAALPAGGAPCLPGLIMLAAGAEDRDPAALRALLAGNVCRCAGHEELREAVVQTASAADLVR